MSSDIDNEPQAETDNSVSTNTRSTTGPKKLGKPEQSDETPPETVSDTEKIDGIRQSYENAIKEIENFDRLDLTPVIKHLRELWEAKGLDPEDPAHLVFEGLGIHDQRQRAVFGKMLAVQHASDSMLLLVHDELTKGIRIIGELEGKMNRLSPTLELLSKDNIALKKLNKDMIDTTDEVISTLVEVQAVLENRTVLAWVMNWAIPSLTLITGFVLRGFFQ